MLSRFLLWLGDAINRVTGSQDQPIVGDRWRCHAKLRTVQLVTVKFSEFPARGNHRRLPEFVHAKDFVVIRPWR